MSQPNAQTTTTNDTRYCETCRWGEVSRSRVCNERCEHSGYDTGGVLGPQTEEFVVRFVATMYGETLTGTVSTFGWTPSEETKQVIAAMKIRDRSKGRRMEMKCMRESSKQRTAAWDARCSK